MKYLNLDCMDAGQGLPSIPDGFFDWAIVDPPWALGHSMGFVKKKRTAMVKQKDGSYKKVNRGYDMEDSFDSQIPSQEYFDHLFRVSRNQIIWGINHYVCQRELNIGSGRIFWDKCNGATDFSDGELAYCSAHSSIRMFRYMWNGMLQGKSISEGHVAKGNKKKNEKRIHPYQKPVNLYLWICQQYLEPGMKVLDTHVGSGSSLIAYEYFGVECLGFEHHPGRYADSTKRIEEEKIKKGIVLPKNIYFQGSFFKQKS